MSASTLSRSLQPLAASLWGAFVAWSILLGAVWVGRVDDAWLVNNVAHSDLRLAGAALIYSVVPAWLALAAVNMHLAIAREEGLRAARRWLFTTLLAALVLGMAARRFGIPFGAFDFKDSLGPRLLGVPIGWLLLWYVLVAGARDLVLWLQPRMGHAPTAIAGAALVVGSLAILQPLVVSGREGFRFWVFGTLAEPGPVPWYAPVVALAFAGGLGWMMREMQAPIGRSRRAAEAWLVWTGLAAAVYLRGWVWG